MFVIRKSKLIIISILIITSLTFALCFSALGKTGINKVGGNAVRVVLDAGHGGIDGGVSGVNTGVKESELNLAVVKKLEDLLIGAGMSVILTRNGSAGLYGIATKNLKRKDMEKRKEIIEKSNATLVVSVHMNKYALKSRRGAQVFYKPSDEKGKLLANCVQSELNDMQEVTRKFNCLSGDYYILNCSSVPSIIAECGFLSNPEDEVLLVTDEYQSKLAYAIFKGIVSYLSEAS